MGYFVDLLIANEASFLVCSMAQIFSLSIYRIAGIFRGGKIFVDVQIFFHSWFNVRGVRRSRPHVFKIICVVIPCI